MGTAHLLHILKPNVSSLGYALFLAINAAGVWGGVFPFLPMEFQTQEIVFGFFLAQSLVVSLSYFASALGVYFFPGPTRRFLVVAASVPYFLGWCCLIGAIYIDEIALTLVVIGGALLGLGSAGFYMLWQRLFASQEAETGNRDLILGTAYASLFYFSLYLIPGAVTVYLIPLVFLPLFGLCIVLKSRTIDPNQPMFEDIPRAHPRIYRQILHDYWRSALAIGALGFCCGIMRSLAIGDPQIGPLVNILSMGSSLVAAVALLLVWQVKNVRLNVTAAYRIFFPFLISAFVLLPVFGEGLSGPLASALYAVYSCAIMLMMIQCAQASRDRGINPVFIYGFFGGIVYLLHDVGFVSGTFAEQFAMMNIPPLAAVAVVALYLLGLMYFIGQGGFRQILSPHRSGAESIELVALMPRLGKAASGKERPQTHRRTRGGTEALPDGGASADSKKSVRGRAQQEEPAYRDRISKQAAALQRHYRLSARETEVMEFIARGNSVARIAEELVVSENTIRTHSKRIYTKLAIHKKQELLDLIESFEPSDLD
ncbi:helix-turn-helix transcriptional regulator [Raoultibacter massiliensis]|uniref:Helix-turn-helix transcriptional regulator n=1 Tax=Raoultibacter massiliensis TaxID=1852371 RepID=A0ABV1JAJ1_9ACTN|nr:helix-turn-helix transcriptional regulator [Raoultibacter massiliensis]